MKKVVASVAFAIYFAIAVLNPFFHKELIFYSPFPFFNSMCVTLVSSLTNLILCISIFDFSTLVGWIPKNSDSYILIVLSGLFFTSSICISHLCYSLSDVDFIVVFSFASILFESVLAIVFGKNRLTQKTAVSLSVMFIGLVVACANFEWSVDSATPVSQIMTQVAFGVSIAMLAVCKHKLRSCGETKSKPPQLVVDAWVFVASNVFTLVMFLVVEGSQWSAVKKMFGFDYLTLMFFGAAIHIVYAICGDYLRSSEGFGFSEGFIRFRCLPVLLISVCVNPSIQYGTSKVAGILLVLCGYVGYSLNTEKKLLVNIVDSDGDTESLLSGGLNSLDDSVFERGTDEEEDE